MDTDYCARIVTAPSGMMKVVTVSYLVSLLAGCASMPNQMNQCNSVARQLTNRSILAQKVDRVTTEVVLKFNGVHNVEEFQAVAQASTIKVGSITGETEQLRKSMAALALKDTGLMSFRDRALASLAKRTSILKEVETELQRVNSTAAIMRNAQEGNISMQPLQSIMAKMDDVDVTEKKNVSAFNLYCKATPKGP
jgi:hypothetical protein